MGIGMDQHQHLGYLWVGNGGVDFGLDWLWVGGGGLWILVWIGEVGLLWFKAKVLWVCYGLIRDFLFLMKMLSLRAIGEGFW